MPTSGVDYGPAWRRMCGMAGKATAHAATAETHEWTMGAELNQGENDRLRALLVKHRRSFAFSMSKLGRCNVLKFRIPVTSPEPV